MELPYRELNELLKEINRQLNRTNEWEGIYFVTNGDLISFLKYCVELRTKILPNDEVLCSIVVDIVLLNTVAGDGVIASYSVESNIQYNIH
jgi:hypothetical protein